MLGVWCWAASKAGRTGPSNYRINWNSGTRPTERGGHCTRMWQTDKGLNWLALRKRRHWHRVINAIKTWLDWLSELPTVTLTCRRYILETPPRHWDWGTTRRVPYLAQNQIVIIIYSVFDAKHWAAAGLKQHARHIAGDTIMMLTLVITDCLNILGLQLCDFSDARVGAALEPPASIEYHCHYFTSNYVETR